MIFNKLEDGSSTVDFEVMCPSNEMPKICGVLDEYLGNAEMIMQVAIIASKEYELGTITKEKNTAIAKIAQDFIKPLLKAESNNYTCEKCPFRDLNKAEHFDLLLKIVS